MKKGLVNNYSTKDAIHIGIWNVIKDKIAYNEKHFVSIWDIVK